MRAYRNGLGHFQAYLTESNLPPTETVDRVGIQHFIDFMSWLPQNGFSKGSLRVYIAGVKFFEEWLILRDILQPDFSNALRFQKAAQSVMRRREKPFPRIPARDDDLKMLEAARQMTEVELLYSTGCRINEVAKLKIKDLDLAHRTAIVTGKGEKQRRIFWSPEAAEALKIYFDARKHKGPTDPVFCRHDKGSGEKKAKPITTKGLRDIIREIAAVAGIDPHTFTPHSFRHAFAIRVLRETRDLALVQDLLGHADPGSTRVYATIYPDEAQAAHRKVFG
jgi:site-specific recombinase XerD